MQIDSISQKVIKIALYLDSKVPGIVSEIWIDEKKADELKEEAKSISDIQSLISSTIAEVNDLQDNRRKQYLLEIISSLTFQIENVKGKVSFSSFSENAYKWKINKVTKEELDTLESKLTSLEKKMNCSRFDLFKKHAVNQKQYQEVFERGVQEVKKLLPKFVTEFKDEGFIFEVTNNKPWSAFNSHIAPFKSKLTINSDISFTDIDLHRLASHEAYGGHHSELSHKDSLLIKEGRGEHGLVITFSPQTFVSEAIAEGMYVLLGLRTDEDLQMMGWYYDRLIFALQNLATFLCFDEGLSRVKIDEVLKQYGVTDKTREGILNFSTDPLFGKYAPVYYSAFNFISDLYENTSQKDDLITTLFTKPCTPELLITEFS